MSRLIRAWLPCALFLSLSWLPAPAWALTTCTANSTSLAFGSTDGTSAASTSATITVTCTTTAVSLLSTVRVRMCLNIGTGANGAGQATPRRMTNPFNDPMQFQIYRDPGHSLIWGSSSLPGIPTPLMADLQYSVLVLGGGGTSTHTMYARIPVQAGLNAGSFSSPFDGTHTRLDYRYAEQLIGAPSYPSSCTSGGTGGSNTTFPFTVTASVPSICRAYVTTDLDFGTVPGLIDANRDGTSTIAMTCTGRTAWNVGLDNGQNAAGNLRRMRQGDSHVAYELYREPARTSRWGTTVGTDTVPGTGTGATQTLIVHGRVPSGQTVPAGNYSDTIKVTITY